MVKLTILSKNVSTQLTLLVLILCIYPVGTAWMSCRSQWSIRSIQYPPCNRTCSDWSRLEHSTFGAVNSLRHGGGWMLFPHWFISLSTCHSIRYQNQVSALFSSTSSTEWAKKEGGSEGRGGRGKGRELEGEEGGEGGRRERGGEREGGEREGREGGRGERERGRGEREGGEREREGRGEWEGGESGREGGERGRGARGRGGRGERGRGRRESEGKWDGKERRWSGLRELMRKEQGKRKVEY